MTIQIWQAALLGICACLASMPGLGGTSFGNYTLGRPLVAGLVVGLIMGNVSSASSWAPRSRSSTSPW